MFSCIQGKIQILIMTIGVVHSQFWQEQARTVKDGALIAPEQRQQHANHGVRPPVGTTPRN